MCNCVTEGGGGWGIFLRGDHMVFGRNKEGISRHQKSIKEVPSNIDRPLTANEGDYKNSTEPTG